MIKVVYTNIESKIKINGLLSVPLTLMLVRHGCLLSMLLYNVMAEVLATFNSPVKKIKGIQIGGDKIKIVTFADNTTSLIGYK